MEKYIYCPRCKYLEIHIRATGEAVGWLCQNCNRPLSDYEMVEAEDEEGGS